jgi:hypothetical protein
MKEAAMRRRGNSLMMEYEFIKNFKVVLRSPDGGTNTSYRLEELFEMFELTRNKK